MIKAMEVDKAVEKRINGKGSYFKTVFVADTESDVAAMNANGSEYLNYPAGSAVICVETGSAYLMNASENEYVEV